MKNRNTYSALQRFGVLYIEEVKRDLRDKGLISTGELERSFTLKIEEEGNNLVLIVYGADHGEYVDKGTLPSDSKPSKPMVERIVKWMKTKGMRPLARQKRGRFRKQTEKTYRKAAYALSGDILRKGIVQRFGWF